MKCPRFFVARLKTALLPILLGMGPTLIPFLITLEKWKITDVTRAPTSSIWAYLWLHHSHKVFEAIGTLVAEKYTQKTKKWLKRLCFLMAFSVGCIIPSLLLGDVAYHMLKFYCLLLYISVSGCMTGILFTLYLAGMIQAVHGVTNSNHATEPHSNTAFINTVAVSRLATFVFLSILSNPGYVISQLVQIVFVVIFLLLWFTVFFLETIESNAESLPHRKGPNHYMSAATSTIIRVTVSYLPGELLLTNSIPKSTMFAPGSVESWFIGLSFFLNYLAHVIVRVIHAYGPYVAQRLAPNRKTTENNSIEHNGDIRAPVFASVVLFLCLSSTTFINSYHSDVNPEIELMDFFFLYFLSECACTVLEIYFYVSIGSVKSKPDDSAQQNMTPNDSELAVVRYFTFKQLLGLLVFLFLLVGNVTLTTVVPVQILGLFCLAVICMHIVLICPDVNNGLCNALYLLFGRVRHTLSCHKIK